MIKKSINVSILYLFLLLSIWSCSSPESPSVVFRNSYDSLMNAWSPSNKFNGIISIELPDTSFITVKGVSRFREQLPLRENDVFYLGSIAKQFTSMAILMEVQNGHLHLEDTLYQFFPELPAIVHGISVRNLLNHTSGIPDYYNAGVFMAGMTNEMVFEYLKGIKSLDFNTGASFSYSNSGYVLLSMILEKASGKSYRNYVKDFIFTPLDMLSTEVYDQTKPRLSSRALGHYPDGSLNDYMAYTTGGGGIFSNVQDLRKWMDALDQHQLLSGDLEKEMYSPAPLSDGTESNYGFGWFLEAEQPGVYYHSGSLAGYKNMLYRDTNKGIRIVILSNFMSEATLFKNDILTIIKKRYPEN